MARLTRSILLASLAALPVACAESISAESTSGGAAGDPGATGAGGDPSSTAAATGTGGSGPCTSAEHCAASSDSCNVGTCINGVCEKTPANELMACDDGKGCTQNDRCVDGLCTGDLGACPSTDPCRVGVCDVESDMCIEVSGNDGAACVDQDPCTITGICGGGTCNPGQPVDCSFLDGTCSVGTCDPQLGCVAMPLNDGASCDDGLYCTIGDTCTAGVCSGMPNTCAAPGDVCLIGTCDELGDTCVAVPGNNGAACNDQSTCTTGETCSNGVCGGGMPANPGGACDDKNPCTTGDTCANGACVPGGPPPCQSGDGCCPLGCAVEVDDDCGCLNPGGGALQAENGLGLDEMYCYGPNDTVQVRAQKACESHFGIGNCCVITGGYQDQQYGECGMDGGLGSIHWHWDNHPDGHCDPFYVVGQVVSPGWCGVILGSFLD